MPTSDRRPAIVCAAILALAVGMASLARVDGEVEAAVTEIAAGSYSAAEFRLLSLRSFVPTPRSCPGLVHAAAGARAGIRRKRP
jgi:hypothetical protein